MATTPKALVSRRRDVANAGPPPSNRFSPFKEIGSSGVSVYGGRVMSREKSSLVSGPQRWITYADMVANVSIVAAGVRYFLNIIAAATWTVKPKDEEDANSVKAAEFVDSVINGMTTPWRKVARRAAMYRFMGFGVQEWTAKRREEDGKVGLEDIEARPQHTIDRWETDAQGTVLGVWQISPQTFEQIYLPRKKVFYLVEDSLTDAPDGLGLYRHLVEPYTRLNKYLLLEGQGFERDLRGIPIGRVPYTALKAAVTAGAITELDAAKVTAAIENFVKMQSRSEDTSIVLDSVPYVVENEGGKAISGVMQYGLELLTGQSPDFAANANAIDRLNREMARILGAEHLLLGGEGSANRALSEDKSRNFYQVVNGAMDDISDGANTDIVALICMLNGIPEEFHPKVSHSDVSFRTVQEITASLREMATAGAVLQPNDPVINDVRDMLGVERAPEVSPEMVNALAGIKPAGEEDDGIKVTSAGEPAVATKDEDVDDEDEVKGKKAKKPNPFAKPNGKVKPKVKGKEA